MRILIQFSHLLHSSGKQKSPPRFRFQVDWWLAHGKVNTCDILQRRRPGCCYSPHWCVMCKIKGRVHVDHVFVRALQSCFFSVEEIIYGGQSYLAVSTRKSSSFQSSQCRFWEREESQSSLGNGDVVFLLSFGDGKKQKDL